MCVCTRLLNTHTHTHFPVQISPPAVHFSLALWSLFVSLCPSLQTPILFFFPSLLFCYISCVSAFLPLSACVSDSPFSFHSQCSESVIKYFIMSLWTKWNLVLSSSCTYFFFLPTPVASQRLVLPPVSGMQPCCNTKCFSVLNLQVSGVFLNVDLFW